MKKKITVKRIKSGCYEAFLEDGRSAEGESRSEAVGHLIRQYSEDFNLEIEHPAEPQEKGAA